jgi:ACS family hexuronate transporter-like MFS transporter
MASSQDDVGRPPAVTQARMVAVVAVSTLAMTVSYVDRQSMAALGPTVKRALGLGHAEWGALTSAFSIAYLLGAPLAGALVDRIGARRGLVVAVVVWSAVAAMHAMVTTFAVLFLLRILLGLAESPTYPAAARSVGAVAPPRARSGALAWLFTGSSIGAAIAGPAAIKIEAHTGSFRLAFIGIALVGLLYAPVFWFMTRHPTVAPLIERRETRSRGSLREVWALLREPAMQRAAVLVIASAPAIMLVLNWGPQLLETQLGVPQRAQAIYVWIPPLAFDAGAVVFGAVASFRDRRQRTVNDLVMVAALLEGCLAFVAWTKHPGAGIALCAVSMAGGGALYALAAADLFRRIGLQRAGVSGGLAAAAQSLAHIIAAPIVGLVLDRTHTYHDVLIALGSLSVPGALAWIMWPVRDAPETAA